MTNQEAIAEVERIEQSIKARVAEGEIPPAPTEHRAAREWFDTHVRCVVHPYAVRERGETLCRECLGFAVVSPPKVVHEVIPSVQATIIPNAPLEFVSASFTVEPEQPRRVRRVRPA